MKTSGVNYLQKFLSNRLLIGFFSIAFTSCVVGVSYAENLNNLPQGTDVDTKANIFSAANAALRYSMPTIGKDAPDWIKRIELGASIQQNGQAEWSILTVQPLYQSEDFKHTFFTQLSQLRYNYLGYNRDVTNAGLGYRQLFADNTVLVGVNGFYDHEWKRGHKRFGYGAELKWSGLDLTANGYEAISNKVTRGLNTGIEEEALSGYDAEASLQLPYLPWARMNAKYYQWNAIVNADDIKGYSVGVQADLTQNFSLEAGVTDDNYTSNEVFAKFTFSFPVGGSRKAVAASKGMVSKTAWNMRDMKDYTLVKVRRQNKIILEQSSSGVVITRGN